MQPRTGAAPAAPAAPDAAGATPVPARSQAGMHRRLTLNSLSNVSSYGVSLAIGFALTPFIVRTLGDSLYGFWVLLMSFIGYASILEMGVQPAVVKLVGQYKARGDEAKLRELLSAAFFFFLAVGGLAVVVFALVLPPLVPRFIEDLARMPHMRWLFTVLAADALIMFMNYLFAGILFGWQLYYAKNLIDIGTWLLNAALLVLFLPRGGMLALAASKLATDLCALGATILVCRRAFPALRLRRRELHRGSFRELLGFGSRIFVSATTTRLMTHAQPIIISTGLSAAATAFYAIPSRLVDYSRQLSWGLTTGFMPMFSELHSRQERALLKSIYVRYSRYVLLSTMPILVVLFLLGTPFIALWIGPEYAANGHLVLLLLAGSTLVESLQPLLWRFFIGVGQLGVLVRVSALASGLVILAGIALVVPWGIPGVAVGVLAGSLVSQLIFARHTCRFLGIGGLTLFRSIQLRPLAAGGLLFALALGLVRSVGTATFPALLVCGGCTVVAYLPIAWYVALDSEERRWVFEKLRRLRGTHRQVSG